MKKVSVGLLALVSVLGLTGCDSKEVKSCKKLMHQELETLCNSTKEALKTYKEGTDEYTAVVNFLKATYPGCFDKKLYKETVKKIDLACESNPSVATASVGKKK